MPHQSRPQYPPDHSDTGVTIKPTTFHWDRFTSAYATIEILLGLLLTILGVMFCYHQGGVAFNNQDQLKFAYGVLGYGLALFLLAGCFSYFVVNTYRGFIILIISDIILGLVSIGFGLAVFISYKSVMQHQYIVQYLWPISGGNIIIGAIAIIHGVWVLLHGLSTFLKRLKTKPNYEKLKKKLIQNREQQVQFQLKTSKPEISQEN